MKKKNFKSTKEKCLDRWLEEDYPGGSKRFQIMLFAKDIAVFCLLPIVAIMLFKILENSISSPKTPERKRVISSPENREKHSQIISFQKSQSGSPSQSFSRRAPGTLVRVRLMNVVETFGNAPVHAQIIDNSLGKEFYGGTLIGDATSEHAYERVNITFKFARHPVRLDLAVPISARAMSLDGTFGLNATKKEGFFARSAIRSASSNPNTVDAGTEKQDMKSLIARALASGLMQEFHDEASVAHNNAQVLTLKPMTEFYVELTDYFPEKH